MFFRWLVLCFVFLSFLTTESALGQEWKNLYDQALKSYQAQEYNVALANAEKAYSEAADPVNKAYSIQLITAICVESQQFSKGIEWVEQEIKLFVEAKETHGAYAEALKKQIMLLAMKGDEREALEKATAFIPEAERIYGITSYEYCQVLLMVGNLFVTAGNFTDAKKLLHSCVSALSKFADKTQEYLTALYLSGLADYHTQEFASTETKLREYLSLSEKNGYTDVQEFESVKALLSKSVLNNNPHGSKSAASDKVLLPEDKLQYNFKKGLEHQNVSQLDSASKYYAVCEVTIDAAGIKNATAFSVLINYASVMIDKNKVDEARSKIEKARKIAGEIYDANDIVEYSYLYKAEADLALASNETDNAQKKYLQIVGMLAPVEADLKVRIVKDITQKLIQGNCLQAALASIETLAADTPSLLKLTEKDRVDVSRLYTSLLPYNRNTEAITFLTTVISSIKGQALVRQLQLILATQYLRGGDFSKAKGILFSIINERSDEKLHADAIYHMGRVSQQQGQYKEAEQYYFTAVKSYKALSAANELGNVYNSLATLYMSLGNYYEAERLYSNLLKEPNTPSFFFNTIRQNLASLYELTMRYEEGQKLLKEVLKKDQLELGQYHPYNAITLQNLAVLYMKRGKTDNAKELLMQAIEIDRRNGAVNTLPYAAKIENLGKVHQESGDLVKAGALYEEALKIRESITGKEHPDYIFNLYGLAVLSQRTKNYENAHVYFKEVTSFYIRQINELFPALSDIERTAFCNKINEVILAYQDFAVEYGQSRKEIVKDLYDFHLYTKALLLHVSSKIRHRIVNSNDEELLLKYNEWQRTKEHLSKLYTLPAGERARQEQNIQTLQLQSNELEKYLASKSELFASEYERKKISWEDVKGVLAPGEAAVEMIRLRLNQKNDSVIYVALILKADSKEPVMALLPNGRQLEGREFNNYRNCIQFQFQNDRSYDVYWKPIAKELTGVHTVFFSPDGIYNKINLLTLFNSASGKYLIDDFNVSLVSNTRETLNVKTKGQIQPAEAVLLGFPDYSLAAQRSATSFAVSQVRDFDPAEFFTGISELPGTKEEVNKINDLLTSGQWKTRVYLREQATEEVVKSVRNPALLHIATHGFFMASKDDNTSAVYSTDLLLSDNNPLLRSGLVLAGAEKYFQDRLNGVEGKGTEDEILTALEVMNLNLDRTELVVLSACETGSGQIRNGEGVFGLQRSFLISGARSVMMSLWKVNDLATQELMVLFYKHWMMSGNKQDALRKTQLAIKNKYPDPYYWGGFVMMGI